MWNIKRKGHRVYGEIIPTEGPDKGNTYFFDGLIKNLVFTGSYSSSSRQNLDRGVFNFMIKKNGNSFLGYCAMYSDPEHDILSFNYTGNRVPTA